MKVRLAPVASVLLLLCGTAFAEINIVVDHNAGNTAGKEFKFNRVPAHSATDAATTAKFSILLGDRDDNGGGLGKLRDGKLPTEPDQPEENFFFDAGTSGGRLLVDLGGAISIKQINTYSWHPADRGPQCYTVYGAAAETNVAGLQNGKAADPEKAGWKLIAKVDTRPKQGPPGGQYGASISDSEGTLGNYRYLLFHIARTETRDAFGNTFFSEIDVCDASGNNTIGTNSAAAADAGPAPFMIRSADGSCEITINTAAAPELKTWAEETLAPVLAAWYPKIVAMLPSEGYSPPTQFSVTLRPERGVAATSGTRISANSAWIKSELKREAVGALVHEVVHVVQQYRGRRGNPNATRPPGWLVEGIPDYIRWFLYEPESHGADSVWLKAQRNPNPTYDAGYRISANFLNYVVGRYDPDKKLITKLNAACRMGTYTDDLWKESTGKTLEELSTEWRGALENEKKQAS